MQTTVVTPKTSSRVRRQENGLVTAMQELLGDLTQLPPNEQEPQLYCDWGEEEEFTVQVGRGECAQ